jgi:hypothetical protein
MCFSFARMQNRVPVLEPYLFDREFRTPLALGSVSVHLQQAEIRIL